MKGFIELTRAHSGLTITLNINAIASVEEEQLENQWQAKLNLFPGNSETVLHVRHTRTEVTNRIAAAQS